MSVWRSCFLFQMKKGSLEKKQTLSEQTDWKYDKDYLGKMSNIENFSKRAFWGFGAGCLDHPCLQGLRILVLLAA